MDLFGIKRRRKERHESFMNSISKQSDEYLLTAFCALDMNQIDGASNEYTSIELRAVENELDKRGYVDEMGYVIIDKKQEISNKI